MARKVEITERPNDEVTDQIILTGFLRLMATRRVEVGLTAEEVADQLGMTGQTILNWESGKNSPRLPDVQRWARALGVQLVLSVDVPA